MVVSKKDEFYRSGNPGYETDKPLILGMESDPAKPQKVQKDGTRLLSHDQDGNCVPGGSSSDVLQYTSRLLQFE